MTQNQARPISEKGRDSIRPVLIVDAETLKGQYVFLQHLFVGLADESCAAALVCPPGAVQDLVPAGPVEIITHPAFRVALLWRQNARKLLAALERFKPTLLHSLSAKKANLTNRLSHRLGLPYVITFNSVKKPILRHSISSKRCAAVVAPAEAVACHAAKVYPALTGRIKQINMGTFAEDECACFSRPGRATSMVIVHPLERRADFEPFFNAVKHLVIEGYELAIMIIGTGRAEPQIRRLLRDLQLSQLINLVGYVQPLRSVFMGADIFIQPQPLSVFNGNLIQAMSVGMAVAACRGGVDDFLVDVQTAVIFDPDDELSIYAALQKLLDKKEFARQIAANAQAQIRTDYSVSKMVTAFLSTYFSAGQWLKR